MYIQEKMHINFGFESYVITESENILAYYFSYLFQSLRKVISCDGILPIKF